MQDLPEIVARSFAWMASVGRRRRRAVRPDDPVRADAGGRTIEDALADRGLQGDEVARWSRVLRDRAGEALAQAQREGVEAISLGDGRYPSQLSSIADPPLVLWVRGEPDFPPQSVAIVGSRAATPHALEVAHRLGDGLARVGIAVVSGLARGVDSAAHRGALDGGGRTVAVLGSGVDVIYPPEHRGLAGRIAACGAVVSELPPATPPDGWHFPRRNRIISGLSLAVVVVEASESSGSLITAGCGLDQGRTVMAVPGGVLSGRNRGAHALIKDGARVVEGVEDVLQELHFDAPPPAGDVKACAAAARDPVLRRMIPGETYDLESLMDLTGFAAVPLLTRLAELELNGLVARAGGGRFLRAGRTC